MEVLRVRKDTGRAVSPHGEARQMVEKWRAAVERGDQFAWDDIERDVVLLLCELEEAQEAMEEVW